MSVTPREDVQGGRQSCQQMSLSTDQDPEKKVFTILLVGEGNFSFSASLCDISQDHITTTCFEPEDTVSKQQLAWRNVQHLRSKGAVVYFGVDATKLHEYTFLANQLYDRIVFNFPHCGRKAGVKKNRDLLSNFFRSCADVLIPKGEIHVALCQGQGGTPADQPKREWHNSWQVVAMAASAGFILTSVVPFDPDLHNGYQSTGYRSQEKSFHVVGALNHVFTRGLPLENIKALQIIEKLTSGQEAKCIDVEADRGFLGKASRHPIRLLYEDLIKLCQQKMSVNVIEDTFSLTCHKDCLHRPPYLGTQANLYFMTPSKEEGNAYLGNIHTNPTMGRCHLRPSLTCHIEELTHRSNLRPNLLTIVSGLVFRKCLISPVSMPVYHEVLMLQDYQDDTPTVQLQLLMDTITNAIETVSASIISDSSETTNNEKTENPLSTLSVTFHKVNEDYTITMSPADCDQVIGTIKMVPPGNRCRELGFLIVALNLDLMAMCLLGIEDWRMLWTEDERFIEQFHSHNLKPFQSFSLYPPYYIHDVSFWVEGNSIFDDVEFHTIALQISKGNIVDIQLLDRYENAETGKTGLCYRLKYQACDRALSYRSALTMQLQLRDELQRCLQVILR
ncbi:ferredoxin-fold anticodon-binding domain-containing protein 1 [Leptodactylus fuscus]|uniref:ferredoxin-fold anticodon-binding domain-containing protein 1 n=1 Tax=Leptodactylus fuscus TaxID=238119 RepID=UPI003F4E6570